MTAVRPRTAAAVALVGRLGLASPRGLACALGLVCALGLGLVAAPALADEPPRSISRDGRGLVYGVGAAFLLGLTPLTGVDGPAEPALSPGWSVVGRFGVELPPGISIALVGGGGGMAASVGSAHLFLRALADVRYTIDLGDVRPIVSVAAGFLLLKAGPNLRATFTSEAMLGLEIAVAPWAALEASVGAEVIAPGDALREVMIFAMLPRLGASFSY